MTTLHITLSGMTCDQCKARVTAALAEVEGVETVAVDRLAGIGTVVLKEGADPTATLAAMQSAVEAGGRYRIEGAVPEGWCPNPDDKILTLGIEGMTCDKCKAHVTAALAKVLGVGAVEVDREAGTARVVIPPCLLALPEVLRRALHEAVEAGGRYRIVAILGLPVPPAPPLASGSAAASCPPPPPPPPTPPPARRRGETPPPPAPALSARSAPTNWPSGIWPTPTPP